MLRYTKAEIFLIYKTICNQSIYIDFMKIAKARRGNGKRKD